MRHKTDLPATLAHSKTSLQHNIWTASEYAAACRQEHPDARAATAPALAQATRRAHYLAVCHGLGWNLQGRYPITIWLQALQS